MGVPKPGSRSAMKLMLQTRWLRLACNGARPIVVVAAPNQEIPELPGDIAIVRDLIAGRGPLQGLAAGFSAVPDTVELAFATATDVPFEPRWITRLVELIDGYDLAIPSADGYYHPLAAMYRFRVVLPVIDGLLREDRLRPVFLVEAVKSRIINDAELRTVDPDLRTLRNLNHPGEYEEALIDFRDSGMPEAGLMQNWSASDGPLAPYSG